jgi:hypothetical protein
MKAMHGWYSQSESPPTMFRPTPIGSTEPSGYPLARWGWRVARYVEGSRPEMFRPCCIARSRLAMNVESSSSLM